MILRLLYYPPFLGVLALLLSGIAYSRIALSARPPIAVAAMRWCLGAIFVFSGLAKLIHGFPNTMGPADLENTLAPYGLATYARFIALSETGIGLLLLTRRFATLGALFLAPMLINILVLTASLHWRGTPYIVTGFLVMDAALLFHDRARLWNLITARSDAFAPHSDPNVRPPLTWLLLLAMVLLVLAAVRIAHVGAASMLIIATLLLGLVVLDWRSAPEPR